MKFPSFLFEFLSVYLNQTDYLNITLSCVDYMHEFNNTLKLKLNSHLSTLIKFNKVKYLNLSLSLKLSYNSIFYIKNITSLDLSYTCADDAMLAIICNRNKTLAYLNLGYTLITDTSMYYINQLTLNSLDLTNCTNITSNGLAQLQTIKNLTELNISGCIVTEQDIEYISKLPIKKLSLKWCALTGPSIEYISNMALLVYLDMSSNPISINNLEKLTRLKNLEELIVMGCNNVTNINNCIVKFTSRYYSLTTSHTY